MTDVEQATADAVADAPAALKLMDIPVVKAKKTISVDVNSIPDQTFDYVIFLGLKTLINRGSTAKANEGLDAIAIAQKNLDAIMTNKVRVVGMKVSEKASGKEMSEARRIAKALVKDTIKAAGEKVSHYEPSEITRAANAYIEGHPEILEQAKANIAAATKKVGEAAKAKEQMAALRIATSAKAIAKANEKSAKAKAEAKPAAAGQLSAKQAELPRKPAPEPKPQLRMPPPKGGKPQGQHATH
jgi:hypothetical protein